MYIYGYSYGFPNILKSQTDPPRGKPETRRRVRAPWSGAHFLPLAAWRAELAVVYSEKGAV